MLLARNNVDSARTTRRLNALDLKSAFEPLEPFRKTDVEGFTRHERDMMIATAVEETRKSVCFLELACMLYRHLCFRCSFFLLM